jgi:cyclophilin family peptidyl-prolyl cis-trans isomerase
MSNRNPNPPPQRRSFALAAGAILAGGLVAVIFVINRANGLPPTGSSGSSPSASASSVTTPAPTATTVAYADCAAVKFGPNLPPFGEPTDRHVYSAAPTLQIDVTKLYRVTITTVRGPIVLCLQPSLAPLTVNNFVALARNHFYDGLKFHRVVASFVVQGGDPQGTGAGGPGYQFNDEPVRQQYVLGAVAMANSGKNTNGSQFFICIADDTTSLAPSYSLFGKVAAGIDVAQRIVQGDVMQTVTVAQQQ